MGRPRESLTMASGRWSMEGGVMGLEMAIMAVVMEPM